MRSILLFASLGFVGHLGAQSAKPPVPRTADGKPDLSGIWQGGGASGLAFAIGANNAKAARPGDAAVADAGGAPVCTWQPIAHGLRHLMPRIDLEAAELNCGIANPVDLSHDIAATLDHIGELTCPVDHG